MTMTMTMTAERNRRQACHRYGHLHVENPRSGFTIIELLVVLAIFGLLVSVTMVTIQNTRAKSRDATREEHVKTLQNALTLHVTNAQSYPVTDAAGVYLNGTDSVSTALISSGSIAAIPRDPLNSGDFRYHYLSANAQTYTITYYLEIDSIPGKSAGQQKAGP